MGPGGQQLLRLKARRQIKHSPQAKAWGESKFASMCASGRDGQPCSLPQCPTEHRCYIKEVVPPICNSGCGPSIAEKLLRLPDNSPFWQHFAQRVLLCRETFYTKKALL